MSLKKNKKSEVVELEALQIEEIAEEIVAQPTAELHVESASEILVEEPAQVAELIPSEIYEQDSEIKPESEPAIASIDIAASIESIVVCPPKAIKATKAEKLEELFRRRHPHMSDEQIEQAVRKRLR